MAAGEALLAESVLQSKDCIESIWEAQQSRGMAKRGFPRTGETNCGWLRVQGISMNSRYQVSSSAAEEVSVTREAIRGLPSIDCSSR